MSTKNGKRSSGDCLGKYLFIVDKYYRQFLRTALKEYDMTSSEAMVLLVLYQNHLTSGEKSGCSQDQLNEELHYDKAALTRTMKLLETRNFVTRHAHQKDKRSYLFTLRAEGVSFMPTIIDLLRKWDQILFAGVTPKQKQVFEEIFLKVAENAGEAARK